ncbi:MAG: Crp/Fnr family transcriptional regulator [Clostridia bacterium]|nr:Crp/Fnr family transcriptional regulator [Clostridia bacterium]
MKKYMEILRSCPLFDGIGNENLTSMLACLGGRTAFFSKKETVIAEGSEADCIGIVLSGTLQIEMNDYFGNRTILGTASPSELFGEAFACADLKAIPVNVVAVRDSEVLFIEKQRIAHPCSNACDFHRRIIYNLLKIVAEKNLMLQQKAQITAKRTTREKLTAYLLSQAKRNNSHSFDIPFNRQELADFLQVDRSGLSAEISKMKKEGIINCRKNHFELL